MLFLLYCGFGCFESCSFKLSTLSLSAIFYSSNFLF
ncbi:hypothetical protein N407_01225 [Helicobacter pylori FD662]|uniref:Uncharacterized protein n=1 Tax=Helicobacter pylori UM114 TaxID=1355531 RepID=T0EUK8_HELPX|nr:hypothetical protein N207_01210 [Helicobacter pylori UM114]EQL69937.1 hypothetical protein N407_01225 [Helicobacter pylori FD662]